MLSFAHIQELAANRWHQAMVMMLCRAEMSHVWRQLGTEPIFPEGRHLVLSHDATYVLRSFGFGPARYPHLCSEHRTRLSCERVHQDERKQLMESVTSDGAPRHRT